MIKKIVVVTLVLISCFKGMGQEADVLKSNGIMYEGQRQYQLAAKNYEQAIEAYKTKGVEDTLCVFKAGQNYVRLKMYEKALPFLQRSVEMKYNDGNIYSELAQAYEGLKQYDKAEQVLKNGIEVFPEMENDYLNDLVYLYFNSKQYEKAVAPLEAALKTNPDNTSLRYLYAVSFENLKQYDKAISEYETILKYDSEHTNSIKKLGYIYFKKTDYLYSKEKKRYEGLNSPSRIDYHNFTKKLEQISEGYRKALPYLEKTHQNNPKDKTIISCLSVSYRRLKMDEKANEMKALLE